MKKTLFLVLFGVQSVSHAFLPPVANLIRDAFDGRKPVSLELVLRHKFTKGDVTTIDEKFPANWQGAAANGIPRGIYQFFRPNRDAREQAQIVLDRLPPTSDFASTTVLNRDEWKMLLSSMSKW